jgi:carbohydrate-binding DOMON domain-containing protein
MREIPQCWLTGQAAGAAAALSANAGVQPRVLDVRTLQKELRRQGVFLHDQPQAATAELASASES